MLLLLLVVPSGRLTPTHTTSWALIRRTGSAEPSDSYNSSERSTEHQNRWKSVHTRAQTPTYTRAQTPTYTPTQTFQVRQYAGQLSQSTISRQSVTFSRLPGQRPPVRGSSLVEEARVENWLHDLIVHTRIWRHTHTNTNTGLEEKRTSSWLPAAGLGPAALPWFSKWWWWCPSQPLGRSVSRADSASEKIRVTVFRSVWSETAEQSTWRRKREGERE